MPAPLTTARASDLEMWFDCLHAFDKERRLRMSSTSALSDEASMASGAGRERVVTTAAIASFLASYSTPCPLSGCVRTV